MNKTEEEEEILLERRGSNEILLPLERQDSSDSLLSLELPPAKKPNDEVGFGFKFFIVTLMTLVWTGYAITTRYTRSVKALNELYSATTVVLLSECIKVCITLVCLYSTSNCSCSDFRKSIGEDFIGKPVDLLKMSVPSIVYTIQNNLDIVALSNLDAATYQVTTQLKVVSTALFMMAFLKRRFSAVRWIAIFLLFCGVAIVQMNAFKADNSKKPTGDNYTVGIVSVLLTCVTHGFAGVYFEMMIKDGTNTSLWIRNLQMCSCGVISAALGCFMTEFSDVLRKGFFHGYDFKVFAVVGFLSLGGIFISLIVKYFDNLCTTFALSVSIVLVVIASLLVFENVHLGSYFIAGTAVVLGAIVLYYSVSE